MESKPLPRPVTVNDFYLAAILDELKGLRADMQAEKAPPVTAVPVIIELREPATPLPVTGTPFPDGFPGRDALEAAGIATLEAIPTDGDELVKIKGIGQATAGRILTELANL